MHLLYNDWRKFNKYQGIPDFFCGCTTATEARPTLVDRKTTARQPFSPHTQISTRVIRGGKKERELEKHPQRSGGNKVGYSMDVCQRSSSEILAVYCTVTLQIVFVRTLTNSHRDLRLTSWHTLMNESKTNLRRWGLIRPQPID